MNAATSLKDLATLKKKDQLRKSKTFILKMLFLKYEHFETITQILRILIQKIIIPNTRIKILNC